jgi:hypothetical protein
MWTLVIAMLVILVLAGLVVLYVAFPHRGEEVPAAPWLGDALRKGVEAAPTLDNPASGLAPEPTPEPEPGAGSLGFTFTEPERTGPSHRGG